MIEPAVQHSFAASADARVQIHQMWICKAKGDSARAGIASAIPLQYVDRAIANANRYPQANFTVWYDGAVTDDMSRFWLGSLVYANARHGNMQLRDLREIPAYATEALFDVHSDTAKRHDEGSVYLRADFARTVLLAHCARHSGARFVMYADMDCPDLRVPEVTDVMRTHGIVLNSLSCAHTFRISNGVIGLDVSRAGIPDQLDRLADETRADIVSKSLADGAFVAFLDRLGYLDERVLFDVQRNLLPPVFDVVPPNPFYRTLGIG